MMTNSTTATGILLASMALLMAGDLLAERHRPEILCDEPVFDFGTKMDSDDVRHTFVIENAGDLTLQIESVRSSCGCTVARLSARELPPGSSAEVEVDVDLSGRRGEFEKTVTLGSNDPANRDYRLAIRGEVIPSLEISPRHLFFRKIAKDKSASLDSFITYNHRTQTVGSVSVNAEFLEVNLETVQPGRKYKVTARTIPPLSASHNSARIVVQDGDGRRLFEIPVWLRVESPLQVAPATIYVAADEGEFCRRQIIVRNGTVDEFTVTGVETPLPEIESSVEELRGYGYRVRLQNIPVRPEIDGKKIVIKTDADGMERIVLPFEYRYGSEEGK